MVEPLIPPAGDIGQLRAVRGDAIRSQLMGLLANVGLVGAGAGVLGRSLGGATTAMQQQLKPHPTYTPDAPIMVDVPVEDERNKRAETNPIYAAAGGFFGGDYARHPMEIPWAMPALAAVGAGSAIGGWKLTDAMLDKLRQHQLNSELAKVKSRYMSVINPPPTAADEKQASSSPLDRLYDQWQEKRAQTGIPLVDQAVGETGKVMNNADATLGPLGLIAGTAAVPLLLTGGGAAALGYTLARRRSDNSVVAKARRSFENAMQQQRPPAILAVPRVGQEDDV